MRMGGSAEDGKTGVVEEVVIGDESSGGLVLDVEYKPVTVEVE